MQEGGSGQPRRQCERKMWESGFGPIMGREEEVGVPKGDSTGDTFTPLNDVKNI